MTTLKASTCMESSLCSLDVTSVLLGPNGTFTLRPGPRRFFYTFDVFSEIVETCMVSGESDWGASSNMQPPISIETQLPLTT